MPPDGGEALDVQDIADRATSYHAVQIRGKICVHDDCTGSHGRVLNTVMHGGAREFRRQGGRGQRRSGRGNGGRAANSSTSSSSSNNGNGGFKSNGNSHGGKQRWKRARCTRERSRQPSLWSEPQGTLQVLP